MGAAGGPGIQRRHPVGVLSCHLFVTLIVSMRRYLPSALMAVLLFLVWGANAQTTTAKKKAPVKKGTPTKSSSKKSPAKSAASSKKGPAKKGAPAKGPAVTWRNRQLSP